MKLELTEIQIVHLRCVVLDAEFQRLVQINVKLNSLEN